MAGYWLHARTPDTPPQTPRLTEETVESYDGFRKRIDELQRLNVENDQIFILFTGNLEEGSSRTWCPDCNIFEDVIDFLKLKARPQGWFLKVRVGTVEEWRNPKNPYKVDHKLEVTTLPTLMVWNTMKRISGPQAFQILNILTILQD